METMHNKATVFKKKKYYDYLLWDRWKIYPVRQRVDSTGN